MEKPILFSTPMVQAILEGRKSQTRRIIKKQPHGPGYWVFQLGRWLFPNVCPSLKIKCPYGEPGDILWVRETWRPIFKDIRDPGSFELLDTVVDYYEYKADKQPHIQELIKWKPSIFMPKEASRISLLIKDIWVEKLNDISRDDVIAEGLEVAPNSTGRGTYAKLWETINGEGSWDMNPWIWVIKFQCIKNARQEREDHL